MVQFYWPHRTLITAASKIDTTLIEKNVYIQFDESIETAFCHFNNENEIVINISAHVSIKNSLELLAHELAHAIQGKECAKDNKAHIHLIDLIWEKYHWIIDEDIKIGRGVCPLCGSIDHAPLCLNESK